MSKIEWTGKTWNPQKGCTKCSTGCKYCYAEKTALWLKRMGQAKYADGFNLTLHPEVLDVPLKQKSPTTYFPNSMSDTFHEDVPFEFTRQTFEVMEKAWWHQFQVLTKRAERLSKIAPQLPWPSNIWIGVTVESDKYLNRVDRLREVPAAIRFLSMEPLLGPVSNLDLTGIHWVIVGGESGSKARPMNKKWVVDIRDQCRDAKVPFFFKQWGHIKNNPDKADPTHKKNGGNSKGGRALDGRVWDEMPNSHHRNNSKQSQLGKDPSDV